LPATTELTIRGVMTLVATIATVGAVTPYALVVFVPVMAVFMWVQAYFRRTSRELKRLDAVSRSPIYSNFSETLDGITTIRAFAQEDNLSAKNGRFIDRNLRIQFAILCTNRWLSIRLELLGG